MDKEGKVTIQNLSENGSINNENATSSISKKVDCASGKLEVKLDNLTDETMESINRELAISAMHRNEVDCHWRQCLRTEKFHELQEEISVLREHHKENVIRKKDLINSIQKEFDYLKDLQQKAAYANAFRVDGLIRIHNDQIIMLQRDFRAKFELLQNEFLRDVGLMTERYNLEKEKVRQCIQNQRHTEQEMKNLLRQDLLHELEEIKNRFFDDKNILRSVLDAKFETLNKKIESENIEFINIIDTRKAEYERLRAKDIQLQRAIQHKKLQADRVQSKKKRLQLITKQEDAQNRERNQALLERKIRAIEKIRITKVEMDKFRKEQKQKLVALSRRGNEMKDVLKRQCLLAGRVKKIVLLCRKLETAREEFASLFRNPTPIKIHEANKNQLNSPDRNELATHEVKEDSSQQVDEQNSNIVDSTPSHSKQEEVKLWTKERFPLWDSNTCFWDKYNMAHLDVKNLEKSVEMLKKREKELREKLKIYDDGITVNDDVLKHRNTLFVINGKTNIPAQYHKRL